MGQQIYFVTGKGGVGKSTVAAAMALGLARENKRVLLIELGNHSFYRDYFELSEVSFLPTPLTQLDPKMNLSVAMWTGQQCLKNYARHLIKIESLVELFFENKTSRTLIDIAPGLQELSILGQITSGTRNHGPVLPFDCFVVDCFATGHFLSLLRAPVGLAKAIPKGPMHEQSKDISEVLRNPDICHFYIVTLPEELPYKESCELNETLTREFGIFSKLIMNRSMSDSATANELEEAKKEGGAVAVFAAHIESLLLREARYSKQKDMITIPMFFNSKPNEIVKLIAAQLNPVMPVTNDLGFKEESFS